MTKKYMNKTSFAEFERIPTPILVLLLNIDPTRFWRAARILEYKHHSMETISLISHPVSFHPGIKVSLSLLFSENTEFSLRFALKI